MSDAPAPTFTGMSLDRAELARGDDAWVRARREDPHARAVAADREGVLVEAGDPPRLARRPLPASGEPILLGLEDGVALFAVDLEEVTPETVTVPLRDAGELLPAREAALGAYLVAVLNWHRRNRYCANCGSPTRVIQAGLARRCPNCAATHFPRLDPVVIMLVEHAGSLLLGRRRGWPPGRYSALAGFVAPGESIEAAVLREVYEESGIIAHNPRFVASQPWPFPASLMLGFHAGCDGGEPFARDGELEDVRWFSEAEVWAAVRGSGSAELELPPRVAIARSLIEHWLVDRAKSGVNALESG